jgi:hypothetical protein
MSTASVEKVEEARAVLERLERIEALDRACADPNVLLGELRELVREAETWAKRERDPRAQAAAETLGSQMTSATTFDGEPSQSPASLGRSLEGMSTC